LKVQPNRLFKNSVEPNRTRTEKVRFVSLSDIYIYTFVNCRGDVLSIDLSDINETLFVDRKC